MADQFKHYDIVVDTKAGTYMCPCGFTSNDRPTLVTHQATLHPDGITKRPF